MERHSNRCGSCGRFVKRGISFMIEHREICVSKKKNWYSIEKLRMYQDCYNDSFFRMLMYFQQRQDTLTPLQQIIQYETIL